MFRTMLLALVLLLPCPISAATKSAIPLRVAYSSISGAGIVTWIAADKGLFTKYGLNVELIYVAGSQAMQSLLSGTTAMGIQGIEPVFRVNVHGADTVMIFGLVTKPTFSIIVRPEIKDYRDCLDCDSVNYGQFVKNMLDRGVRLIGRGIWYLSAAHTPADIDLALGAANDALKSLKND
jgi:ABC-type nitrate/sulfonate/bicarbonate transport system substrate-binding protein